MFLVRPLGPLEQHAGRFGEKEAAEKMKKGARPEDLPWPNHAPRDTGMPVNGIGSGRRGLRNRVSGCQLPRAPARTAREDQRFQPARWAVTPLGKSCAARESASS